MKSKFVNSLTAILNNDPKLVSLQTYFFSVDETNQILYALKNNTTLRYLYLLQNEITGIECGAAIAEMLKYNQTLKTLDASGSHFTAIDFKAICDALTKNKSLKTLDFTGCNIGDIDPNSEELAKVFKINSSIKNISLFRNNINANGINNITEGLKANTNINSLHLDRNPFGDDGAEKLAQVLFINTLCMN